MDDPNATDTFDIDEQRRKANLIQSVIDEHPGADDSAIVDALHQHPALGFLQPSIESEAQAAGAKNYASLGDMQVDATDSQTGEKGRISAKTRILNQILRDTAHYSTIGGGRSPAANDTPGSEQRITRTAELGTPRVFAGNAVGAMMHEAPIQAAGMVAGSAIGGPLGKKIAGTALGELAPKMFPELAGVLSNATGQDIMQAAVDKLRGRDVNTDEMLARTVGTILPTPIRRGIVGAVGEGAGKEAVAGAVAQPLAQVPLAGIRNPIDPQDPWGTVANVANMALGGMSGYNYGKGNAPTTEATLPPEMEMAAKGLGIELTPDMRRMVAIVSDPNNPQYQEGLHSINNLAKLNSDIPKKLLALAQMAKTVGTGAIYGAQSGDLGKSVRAPLMAMAQDVLNTDTNAATPKLVSPTQEQLQGIQGAVANENKSFQQVSNGLINYRNEQNKSVAEQRAAQQTADAQMKADTQARAAMEHNRLFAPGATEQVSDEARNIMAATQQGLRNLRTGDTGTSLAQNAQEAIKATIKNLKDPADEGYDAWTERVLAAKGRAGYLSITPEEAAEFSNEMKMLSNSVGPGLFGNTQGAAPGVLNKIIGVFDSVAEQGPKTSNPNQPLDVSVNIGDLAQSRKKIAALWRSAPAKSEAKFALGQVLDRFQNKVLTPFFDRNPEFADLSDVELRPLWTAYKNADRTIGKFADMDPSRFGKLLTAMPTIPLNAVNPQGEINPTIRQLSKIQGDHVPAPEQVDQVRANQVLSNPSLTPQQIHDQLVKAGAPPEVIAHSKVALDLHENTLNALQSDPVGAVAPRDLMGMEASEIPIAARAAASRLDYAKKNMPPKVYEQLEQSVAADIVKNSQTKIKLNDGSDGTMFDPVKAAEYLEAAPHLKNTSIPQRLSAVPMNVTAVVKGALASSKNPAPVQTPPVIPGAGLPSTPDVIKSVAPDISNMSPTEAAGALSDSAATHRQVMDLLPENLKQPFIRATTQHVLNQVVDPKTGIPDLARANEFVKQNPTLANGPVGEQLNALMTGNWEKLLIGDRPAVNQKENLMRMEATREMLKGLQDSGSIGMFLKGRFIGENADNLQTTHEIIKLNNIIDRNSTPLEDKQQARNILGQSILAAVAHDKNDPKAFDENVFPGGWRNLNESAKSAIPPEVRKTGDQLEIFFRRLGPAIKAAGAPADPSITLFRRYVSAGDIIAGMSGMGHRLVGRAVGLLAAQKGMDYILKSGIDQGPKMAVADLMGAGLGVGANVVRQTWRDAQKEAEQEAENKDSARSWNEAYK